MKHVINKIYSLIMNYYASTWATKLSHSRLEYPHPMYTVFFQTLSLLPHTYTHFRSPFLPRKRLTPRTMKKGEQGRSISLTEVSRAIRHRKCEYVPGANLSKTRKEETRQECHVGGYCVVEFRKRGIDIKTEGERNQRLRFFFCPCKAGSFLARNRLPINIDT